MLTWRMRNRSVITDLGEHLSNLYKLRTNSYPESFDCAPGGLGSQVLRAICRPDMNKAGFLPKGQLQRIINCDAVKKELMKHEASLRKRVPVCDLRPSPSLEDLEDDARKICGRGEPSWPVYNRVGSTPTTPRFPRHMRSDQRFQKIMAILLLIERPSRIRSFVEEGVCDADLPLVKVLTKRIPFKRWELRRRKDRETHLRCFEKWRQVTLEKFEEHQWAVLAPFFARDLTAPRKVPHYYLPDQVILPCLVWERQGEGGFGQVYKAEIHPDHHDFSQHATQGSKKDLFAVKQLCSTDEADFRKEVEILKRISRHPHNHLITLLATYQYLGRYHLIFPWADCDLGAFWRTRMPQNDEDTARWLAEQCRGLASGLATIHQYRRTSTDSTLDARLVKGTDPGKRPTILFCRHGDIKPENILWFPWPSGPAGNKGVLKINDFGTAEFTFQEVIPRTKALPITPRYAPPEACVPEIGGFIGTSYDVWSLGCLYLEFIAWWCGGWPRIDAFMQKRLAVDNISSEFLVGTFFTFINELHTDPRCSEFIHDFLVLIRQDMLVVEGEWGQRRLSSAGVSKSLGGMEQRAARYDGYFSDPAPWKSTAVSLNCS
ncbi:87674b28-6914-427c-8240-07f8f05b0d98 [Thermothielavioides terrestris]|uniref:87674b28-6914-427c-8240-07f8f05b0d98 n=1 Tax=Thermothielavioides terrestris TaxID=2587410 RepID=A0A446BQ41_9PEZI|nr:87674b28-6914-427c-8240-07f8f05b0d98 [Thermothielavioides terrestris]